MEGAVDKTKRPPVIAVMGHVDHGKSTLLDYIRKSNIVSGEAGGITQHISAYEVHHKDKEGNDRRITFIDTPGHEAFSNMRSRGAQVADIAILVVSADDGVKKQTLEAYNQIKEAGVPFVVAINKIDKPDANLQKTQNSLIENEIYLEGLGGNVSYVPVSAKTGEGVDDLLETILLVADIEELKGNPDELASGVVIESDVDDKRGISATLVIKNGTIKKGMFVVVDGCLATTRIFEDFSGKNIEEATFSSPIVITGFSSPIKILGLTKIPRVGETFKTFETKKEAEKYLKEDRSEEEVETKVKKTKESMIPLVIKTDVVGTSEAIEEAVHKIECENACFKIVKNGVGNINESDLTFAQADEKTLVVGFNVNVEKKANDANEQIGATIKTFNIIYELTEWLEKELEERRPKIESEEISGRVKVLRTFSRIKDKQLVGGKVKEGKISLGDKVKIIRRENEIEKGKVVELQVAKVSAKEVLEGNEFGCIIEAKRDIAEGDIIEAFKMVKK